MPIFLKTILFHIILLSKITTISNNLFFPISCHSYRHRGIKVFTLHSCSMKDHIESFLHIFMNIFKK